MWYNIGEKELEFQPAGKDGRDDCNIQSMPVYLPPDKAWSPFPGLLWAFLGDSGASGQRAEKGACGKGRHGSGEGGTSGKNRPAPQKKSCKKTHRLFWKVLIGFTYQYEKLEFGCIDEWGAGGCRTPKGSPVQGELSAKLTEGL